MDEAVIGRFGSAGIHSFPEKEKIKYEQKEEASVAIRHSISTFTFGRRRKGS